MHIRDTWFLLLILLFSLSAQAWAGGWEYKNSPEAVAKALNVDVGLVQAAGQESLTPDLCWMVAKMADRCGCGVAGVMRFRETKSWGEVAKACGMDWVELNEQMDALRQSGAIAFEESTRVQLSLAGANKAAARARIRKLYEERSQRQAVRP
jgi:hypothetical protein